VGVTETQASAEDDHLTAHQIYHPAKNEEGYLLDVLHCEGLFNARIALAAAAESSSS
jgi:hypothetical protein